MYQSSIFAETPSGAINGTNKVFTLQYTPTASSLELYLNGLLMTQGPDYSLSGSTITFVSAPSTAISTILAYYKVPGTNYILGNSFVDAEVPLGTIDGNNTVFMLFTPILVESSEIPLRLYRNGLLQREGIDYDFDLVQTITFYIPPEPGDSLVAYYFVTGSSTYAPSFGGAETMQISSSPYFPLQNVPCPQGALQVFRNGILQQLGVDYTIGAHGLITFQGVSVPYGNDVVVAYYRYRAPRLQSNLVSTSDSFSADGISVLYNLSNAPNLGSPITVTVGGVSKTQNVDYIIYSNIIRFIIPPPISAGTAISVSYSYYPLLRSNGTLIASLIGILREYLNDVNSYLWDDITLERYLVDAQSKITSSYNIIWIRFPMAITANQNTYVIPTNVKEITRMTWKGYPVNLLSQQEIALLSPTYMNQVSSQPRWAYMSYEGYHTLRLYPGPSQSLPILSDQNTIYTDQNILSEFVISCFVYTDACTGYVEIPDFLAMPLIRYYVMWKCYSREGLAQNLELAEYYKGKWTSQLAVNLATYRKVFTSKKTQYTDVAVQRPWRRARPILPPNFGTLVQMP